MKSSDKNPAKQNKVRLTRYIWTYLFVPSIVENHNILSIVLEFSNRVYVYKLLNTHKLYYHQVHKHERQSIIYSGI